jgi:hypothetical protein
MKTESSRKKSVQKCGESMGIFAGYTLLLTEEYAGDLDSGLRLGKPIVPCL